MFNPSYGGESDEFSDRTLNKVMRKIDAGMFNKAVNNHGADYKFNHTSTPILFRLKQK